MDITNEVLSEEEIAAGFRKSDGKRIIDHRNNDDRIDTILADIREDIYEPLLDANHVTDKPITRAQVIAQIIMNALDDGEVSNATFEGRYNTPMKVQLVEIADHMGPDWAQALYHAARFITKVA